MPSTKPIICLDFDGVIHDYKNGWCNGDIYGNITPGFVVWASRAAQHFSLHIYSSRSKDPVQRVAMEAWMRRQLKERMMPREIDHFVELFTFSAEKPPAFITIDDRAITFSGTWEDPALAIPALLDFKPWNAR